MQSPSPTRNRGFIVRFWPFLFVCAGVALVAVGLLYDVLFAGIPYQDPTPDMAARFDFQQRIATWLYGTGVLVFFAGIGSTVLRFILGFAKPKTENEA